MRSKKLAILLAGLLACGMLCGCTLVQFEDPAEIERQEQEIEQQTRVEYPDADALFDPEGLAFSEQLTDESGRVLATYQAQLPRFTGDHPALLNINAYYQTEMEALQEDKIRFFELVKSRPSDTERKAYFTCELLESDAAYISFLRKYESVDTLGQQSTLYFCEVFSAATGLQLRFDNLFGTQAKAARTQVRESLVQWTKALEGEAGPEWIDKVPDADLTANVALSLDSLYIVLPQGTAPNDAQVIELPLSDFESLLKQ